MSARLRLRGVSGLLRRPPAPGLLVASIIGWAALVWSVASDGAEQAGDTGRTLHAAHVMDAASQTVGSTLMPHSVAMWLAMILAMTPLLLLREVGRLWRGSLRRRRLPTIAVFLAGHGLVWVLLGLVVVPLSQLIAASAGSIWLAVALTLIWQCSPLRQRSLNACHRAPTLRVFGAVAHGDAWRYGVITGGACAAACGPIMLLVLIAPEFHVAAMVVATVILTAERYQPARQPRWRLPLAPESPEWRGVRAGAALR
ncbi:DUF2182 domain-containing protein [Microbacterium pumilum]|uniref:DUF2182 domain-containing protein n=1 Tax=Microbacterium pumilum TaxID=344165 RepID=A0ABP5DIY1_9MICO